MKMSVGNMYNYFSSKEELAKLASFEKKQYTYSVEDYFQKPKQSSFKFSPDGKYFSYREKDEKSKNHLYVKNTDTDKVTRIVEEKEDLIRGYGWANDNRLIYVKDKGGDENYHLFAVDLDGANEMELTPFDGVKVNILNGLPDQKDHMIVSMNKDNPQVFEPFKINIKVPTKPIIIPINCCFLNEKPKTNAPKINVLKGVNEFKIETIELSIPKIA